MVFTGLVLILIQMVANCWQRGLENVSGLQTAPMVKSCQLSSNCRLVKRINSSPLTTHHSPLTTHHSPLTTHHSFTHHSFTTLRFTLENNPSIFTPHSEIDSRAIHDVAKQEAQFSLKVEKIRHLMVWRWPYRTGSQCTGRHVPWQHHEPD